MTDSYQPTQAQFDNDVATGRMEILRDDGLYRHLRFRFSGGGFRWFDIVTWPDRLVITGDCETYTFSRLTDMFEFFRSGGVRINPSYWQEKILDGRCRARSFDWDRFRAAALAEFDQRKADAGGEDLRAAARQDLEDALDAAEPDEWGAVDLLRSYRYCPDVYSGKPYFEFDLSDGAPDGKGWDYHYIWCCRAIAWAIRQYDEHHATAEVAAGGPAA